MQDRARPTTSSARSSTSTQHAPALAGELVHRAAGDDLALARGSRPRRRSARPPRAGATTPRRGCRTRCRCGGSGRACRRAAPGRGRRWARRAAPASGSWAMAWASFTRWRWPVDIVPMGRKRSSPSPTDHSASLARLVASRVGQAVHLGDVAHEVVGPGVGRQAVVLGGVADARPHRGAGRRRVEAEHLERAAVGPVQPEHQPEQGGLARAVGAEQPGDARRDAEGGAVERGGRPEATGERGGVDHRGRRCRVLTHGLASVTVPARRPQGRSARSANPRSGCSAVGHRECRAARRAPVHQPETAPNRRPSYGRPDQARTGETGAPR